MNIIPDRLAPVGNFFKVSDTQSAVIYHWQSRAIPINNLVTQPNDFYQVVLLLRQVSDGEIISPCQQTGSSSTVTYRIEYGAARPFLLALKGF
ncbi:MAG: hypothetical protein JW750_04505, partial [Anaerolineaceae bacterium]|nr:hypothetical protein [Anaerolineaceae bacterium]